MKTFDQYSQFLLEISKRFFEKAKAGKDDDEIDAYLLASLFISFSALEAFLNSVISEFEKWDKLTIHELAVLSEKKVNFDKGHFELTNILQMSRLRDRIELLLFKFNPKVNYHTSKWWSDLNTGIDLRNSLTHPKEVGKITPQQIESILVAIINCIDFIFKVIYKKGLPVKSRDLSSKFLF